MDEELCWQAVRARDRAKDGLLYYGVVTTGVYCRPSCGARRPLRENVRFYDRAQDAEKDGLRPCRRCRPDAVAPDPALERVKRLCRYIETHAGERLRLADLGRRFGTSRFHLQRSFKAIVGVTPREYAEAGRVGALKRSLREERAVTEAIYHAGFGSSSRVYERADARLGMTPGQYREGGAGLEISWAASETPLGTLAIAATDRGLCFVQFGRGEGELLERLREEFPRAALSPVRPAQAAELGRWMRSLNDYLRGGVRALELPLDVRGTALQLRTWSYLRRIPYGSVRSYAEVARAIGRPDAVRAVASACGANRVALAIPCHRVIRGDGGLGGYRWGLDRKRALLEREALGRRGARGVRAVAGSDGATAR
jgi:AraC family transcriptional regulator of adaptative response/methylated-DNA-[protein]-cysteine methyltransferase